MNPYHSHLSLLRAAAVVVAFWMNISGCTPSVITRKPVDLSSITPVELVERNGDAVRNLKFLKAIATLNLESAKSANQLSAQIAIKMPDSVYIKIEGLLGIDGIKASLNAKTFVVYNIMNKYVVAGRTSADAIRKTFDYDVSFEEMVELLLGWPVLKRDDLDRLVDFGADGSYFVLTFREDYGSRIVWIDPYAGYAVSKIHQMDRSGDLTVEKEFTRFEIVDGRFLPRYVRIFRPKEQDLLSIYFDTRSINKSFSSKLFTIEYPNSVSVINVE